ncbi:hypothetical protein SIO70_14350 [Chitinophaga sancti]|uniref:hypothetical protein n=1 Tax=Chitinophaga sancti TaxID=1004 RepID=UPI002A74EE63|nr:hypothetical protein [Chitinophaga sancti]WPQ66039.1 hypothetical protein SIO70_14350 [Chitinophaga sancti]
MKLFYYFALSTLCFTACTSIQSKKHVNTEGLVITDKLLGTTSLCSISDVIKTLAPARVDTTNTDYEKGKWYYVKATLKDSSYLLMETSDINGGKVQRLSTNSAKLITTSGYGAGTTIGELFDKNEEVAVTKEWSKIFFKIKKDNVFLQADERFFQDLPAELNFDVFKKYRQVPLTLLVVTPVCQ